MSRLLITICVLITLTAACAPATPPTSTPTLEPTIEPTIEPTVVVENPPACWGGDLIYHPQLQQMLLVNCVADPSRETP